jgi:hypothetical protein
MKRLLALLIALLAAAPAGAFDSHCYVYPSTTLEPAEYDSLVGVECSDTPGPPTARNRWVGNAAALRLDEHRQLMVEAMRRAGLPAALQATQQLRVYTDDARTRVGLLGSVETLRPAIARAPVSRAYTRAFSIAELAQLPDFSYALWDWSSGNEQCPIPDTGSDPVRCHTFASHMGPVNSNHFPPQAETFYRLYHDLALRRAAECRGMAERLRPRGATFEFYARACEVEALTLEAVAQHFLADAWSGGHLWERWGGPDLTDFGGSRSVAALVAAAAGIVHGARALLSDAPYFSALDNNDAMCAPLDPSVYPATLDDGLLRNLGPPRFLDPSTRLTRQMVGDRYADLLRNVLYEPQREGLYACAAQSIEEVYAASGGIHGPVVGATGPRRAVTSEDCFGQRAVNASIYLGMGINYRERDGTQAFIPFNGFVARWVIPTLTSFGADVSVPTPLAALYRMSLTRVSTFARRRAVDNPEGRLLASGGLGPFLGVEVNSRYDRRGTSRPATYVDPQLPWPGPAGRPSEERDRALALAGTFHRAHVADWCQAMTGATLDALRLRARDRTLDGTSRAAACEACAEFAVRHLRLGVDAADYDRAAEPVCNYLGGAAEAFRYLPRRAGADADAMARTWCGCEPTPHGGAWSLCGTTCSRPNPRTGACTCPTGFRAQFIDAGMIPAECGAGPGVDLVPGTLAVCTPTLEDPLGPFAGLYQVTPTEPTCAPVCLWPNLQVTPRGCRCGSGTTLIPLRVVAPSPCGARHVPMTFGVCVRSADPLGDFGGAWQRDDPVPTGLGCRVPNPFTRGCSCPESMETIELRALSSFSTSTRVSIPSTLGLCVSRGR